MEKNPSRRYASAGELADDLRRFLANEPIRARPVRMPERVWKWAVRRPLVASLLVACVLAVVTGVSGVVWQWRQALASQHRHALTQVDLIRHAEANKVETAIVGLREFREWADPELRALASNNDSSLKDRFRGHLALMETDPASVDYVIAQMIRTASPDVLDFEELALGADLLAKVETVNKSPLVELAIDPMQREAKGLLLRILAERAPADS